MGTDPIVIRTARATDVAGVLDLWAVSGAEPTRTDNPSGIASLLAADPDALIVADMSGRIVGSVIAGWDGWRGSIYRLAVAPTERRTGLGRRLLGHAEERLGRLGAVRLQAVVADGAADATGFWRTSGWEEQAGRLRFVRG